MLPDPQPAQPPGFGGIITILNWASWIALVICLLAFIVSAARLAMAYRNGEMEGAKGLVLALVACVLIGSASSIFLAVT